MQERKLLSGLKILIVEDEEMLLELMQEEFEGVGAKVDICSTGQEALDMIRNNNYDVLLTDIRMPEGSGTWLITEIGNTVEHPPIIYLCSGFSSDSSDFLSHSLVRKVFKKPVKISMMIKDIADDLR